MSRYLVTGSAGFIGFHLASSLLGAGHEVVGVDRFDDYYPIPVKEGRHAHLADHPRFRLLRGDLLEGDLARRALEGVDAVCHLAARPGVRASTKDPEGSVAANVTAFVRLLEACRAATPRPRVVYASSSSVYGDQDVTPFPEDASTDGPCSVYAATKKADEVLAHAYAHLFGMTLVGLRFFTVYGPWSRPDMMLWLVTEAVAHGDPLRVYGDGTQRRSFTDVGDIVTGIEAALVTPGLTGHTVVNLGCERSMSVMDLVGLVEAAWGGRATLRHEPQDRGDVTVTAADGTRARALLGYTPSTPLEDTVRRFVAWYRTEPGLAEAVRRWRLSTSP